MNAEGDRKKVNSSMDRITAKWYFSGLNAPGTFMVLR